MEIRHIKIDGRPQAKERPRMSCGHAFTPKRTKEYEAKIFYEYRKKYPNAEKFEGPVAVEVFVYFNINRSIGDLDNYIKIANDGLNGSGVWVDDKQVKEITGYLVVDKEEEMRMEIFIREIEDDVSFKNRVNTKFNISIKEEIKED